MNQKILLIIFICICVFCNIHAQRIASLEAEITKPTYGLDIPASINLDQVTMLPADSLSLFEIKKNKRIPVPFQINNGEFRSLNWLIKSNNDADNKHNYELIKDTIRHEFEFISTEENDGLLIIKTNERQLLGYQYKTKYPPTGIDSVYKRSGFIHPLWSPHGQILTRIQPDDHYHHYGIWNPWTHVLFEKDTLDFWNLGKKQGTVRFADFVSITEGPVYSEYKALQHHVAFKKNGDEKIAISELQSVRIYQPANQDYYIADLTIELNCAGRSPVLLLEYRYGGLGWRTTEKWHKNNSEVLTSEGKTRKDADGTTARWCIVQGEIDNDYAGIVMMSYPTNYNHPEPLRIWPESQNGRGDMFASFSPTKNKDWQLPDETNVLKYRLLVFNGHTKKEKAESVWQNFANPPKIKVKL